MDDLVKECEQLMIDFAKKKDLSPNDMLSGFQTALLNVAGWICSVYKYSDKEYESFMKKYADEISEAVENKFRKEK